jgi:hypothetical protein
MEYQITILQTIADCNSLKAKVEKEKSKLLYEKLTLERSHDSYSERSIQIGADISATTAEITAQTNLFDTLPDGDAKDEARVKKTKAEYHLFTLNEQNNQYGTVALLSKELEINLIDRQLSEIETLIQAIETQKSTLSV